MTLYPDTIEFILEFHPPPSPLVAEKMNALSCIFEASFRGTNASVNNIIIQLEVSTSNYNFGRSVIEICAGNAVMGQPNSCVLSLPNIAARYDVRRYRIPAGDNLG